MTLMRMNGGRPPVHDQCEVLGQQDVARLVRCQELGPAILWYLAQARAGYYVQRLEIGDLTARYSRVARAALGFPLRSCPGAALACCRCERNKRADRDCLFSM